MSENRLPDYLDHIQQAATDARSFVEGMAKDDFLADKRTQQAVIMSLIVIGIDLGCYTGLYTIGAILYILVWNWTMSFGMRGAYNQIYDIGEKSVFFFFKQKTAYEM